MYWSYSGATIAEIEKSVLIALSYKMYIPCPSECVEYIASMLFEKSGKGFSDLIEKSQGFVMLSLLSNLMSRHQL